MTIILVMSAPRGYVLEFAPEVIDHLAAIDRKYHTLIGKTIDEQLIHTPERASGNRKPLERPTSFGATWELRFGNNNGFRVFYDVNPAEGVVRILAIGVKERNRLFVEGKEIKI